MADRVPGLLSGDEPLPEDWMAQLGKMAGPGGVPGLLSLPETPAEAEAAIRNHLKMLDWNRTMAPEGGYALRSESILGGPAYMGHRQLAQGLSPAEQQYWENYAQGLYPTSQDPGALAGALPSIAREAQRVAPMPQPSGPGGVTYPLYQSPYDLYQSLQMSEDNFNTWASRRAQAAVQNPIPGGMPDPIPWRYNRSDPYGR